MTSLAPALVPCNTLFALYQYFFYQNSILSIVGNRAFGELREVPLVPSSYRVFAMTASDLGALRSSRTVYGCQPERIVFAFHKLRGESDKPKASLQLHYWVGRTCDPE
jgi:hypothetical protein